jgi:Rha family phage regulatory protein
LDVAKYFDKRHDNVLRDIREMEVSDSFLLLNFEETSYLDQLGRQQPMYHITKDGFIFLTMGFTGQKAAQLIARQKNGNLDYSLSVFNDTTDNQ